MTDALESQRSPGPTDESTAKGTPWYQRKLNTMQAVAGILLCTVAIVGILTLVVLSRSGEQYRGFPGDGFTSAAVPLAGWFFEQDECLIPWEDVMAGGPPKDGIPALTDPRMITADAAEYLQPVDRVIGIAFNGDARAYPLRILNWHEVVNATVGGKHVAVTYCPLCDSSLVFDRDVGGEVREFGVSGLLHRSNVLLYDRQETQAEESLWSQMQMRAVCGPAAKEELRLRLLPAEITTWKLWKDAHPETTVLSRDTGFFRNYDRNPYDDYFAREELIFPVNWEQAEGAQYPAKERVFIIQLESGELKGYPESALTRAELEDGTLVDEIAGRTIRLTPRNVARTSWVAESAEGEALPVALALWFSFRAEHPQAAVYTP